MDAKALEKKITLGFKLMSGYYLGRISKNDLARLALEDGIGWGGREIDETINGMGRLLHDNTVFKFWDSWRVPLIEATSDAVALNFLLVMSADWKRKGKPRNPSSSAYRSFQRNAVILLDRCIYEYLTRQWRGSGDSRIAANLAATQASPEVFVPIPQEEWNKLIDDAIDHGVIHGVPYLDGVDKNSKLLLLYHYVLSETDGPTGPDIAVDVDHIIPRATLLSVARPEIRRLENHLSNLCLLPSKPNITKSDNRLDQIRDGWLKRQIEKYAGLSEQDFARFSSPDSIMELRAIRGNDIKASFKERRIQVLGPENVVPIGSRS